MMVLRAVTVIGCAGLAVAPAACDQKTPAPAPAAPSAPAAATPAQVYTAAADALTKEQSSAIAAADAKSAPSADAIAILRANAAHIEEVIEATKAGSAQWQIDGAIDDPNTVVPIARARAVARLLRADAARCAAENDADGVCKRVAATVRLSRHLLQDGRMLIMALTGFGVFDMAATEIEAWSSIIKGAAWKTDVQQALAGLNPTDPCNLREVFVHEAALAAKMIRDNSPLLKEMGLTELSPDQREAAAKDIEALGKQFQEALLTSDASARMRQALTGATGVRASGLVGAWLKALEMNSRAAARLATVRNLVAN